MSFFQKTNTEPVEAIEPEEQKEEQKAPAPLIGVDAMRTICEEVGAVFFVAKDVNDQFVRYSVSKERWRIESINSLRFKAWLHNEYFSKVGEVAKDTDLRSAILSFTGYAYESDPRELYSRVGWLDNKIYVALYNDKQQVIEISADGWKVIEGCDCPLWFRQGSMAELPMPERGGAWDEFRSFVNTSDNDFVLVVAWMLTTFFDNPYPILSVSSEQGSGKTVFSKLTKDLLDPDKEGSLSPPKDESALTATATSRWLVSYDNFSFIDAQLSDQLCRLATGLAIVIRMLYTNNDSFGAKIRRPQMHNGIGFLPNRGDYLDRAWVVALRALTDGRRRLESDLWAAFEKARPRIYGLLLDAVCAALREKDYRPESVTRMMDAEVWVRRAEKAGALPWKQGTFEWVLREKERGKQVDIVEGNPVARILLEIAEETMSEGCYREIKISKLLAMIRDKAEPDERIKLPANASVLGKRLERINAQLRGRGLLVDKRTKNDGAYAILVRGVEGENLPTTLPTTASSLDSPGIVDSSGRSGGNFLNLLQRDPIQRDPRKKEEDIKRYRKFPTTPTTPSTKADGARVYGGEGNIFPHHSPEFVQSCIDFLKSAGGGRNGN